MDGFSKSVKLWLKDRGLKRSWLADKSGIPLNSINIYLSNNGRQMKELARRSVGAVMEEYDSKTRCKKIREGVYTLDFKDYHIDMSDVRREDIRELLNSRDTPLAHMEIAVMEEAAAMHKRIDEFAVRMLEIIRRKMEIPN